MLKLLFEELCKFFGFVTFFIEEQSRVCAELSYA
jgi:hypothetical protein